MARKNLELIIYKIQWISTVNRIQLRKKSIKDEKIQQVKANNMPIALKKIYKFKASNKFKEKSRN